ncbi:MAG: hypothetical protein JST89_06585 [Cyanobacteria bacterium SZAS-4]|nr:hypothetical protein [Cyanobacteria bacterium SZAS-4]
MPSTQSQFVFLASGNINCCVARAVPNNEFYARGRELVYQQMLILWVRDRAELAGRTAILTAFWFALVFLAADQLTKFMDKKRESIKLDDCRAQLKAPYSVPELRCRK